MSASVIVDFLEVAITELKQPYFAISLLQGNVMDLLTTVWLQTDSLYNVFDDMLPYLYYVCRFWIHNRILEHFYSY